MALLVAVHVEGERCGEDYPIMCQDSPICWDQESACDGGLQCLDGSDEGKEEGQGCNLYPLSGCLSIKGKLHHKCERTSECFSRKEDAEKCNEGEEVAVCKKGEFKCFSGRCIPMQQACDGYLDCKESSKVSSDEGSEPGDGCNLFDDTSCP